MCGVFGWHLTNLPKQSDMVVLGACLATLNDERGGDSWGYYSPELTDPVKGVGLFGNSKQFKDLAKHSMLIGHTRFKTVGPASIPNAHPFKFGNIIGAHNGGIFNHWALDTRYDRDFDVDSMHIFKHIEEGKWGLDDLIGYGTIEVINTELPKLIYLGRFQSGELSVARTEFGWIWSSSEKHLRISLKMARIRPMTVFTPEEGRYYILDGTTFKKTDVKIGVKSGSRVSYQDCSWGDYDDSRFSGLTNSITKPLDGIPSSDSPSVLRKRIVSAGGARTVYVVDENYNITNTIDAAPSDLGADEEINLIERFLNKSVETTTPPEVPELKFQIDLGYPSDCADCKQECDTICDVCCACDTCCLSSDTSKAMHAHFEETTDPTQAAASDSTIVKGTVRCEGCYNRTNMYCEGCLECPDCCRCESPDICFIGSDGDRLSGGLADEATVH